MMNYTAYPSLTAFAAGGAFMLVAIGWAITSRVRRRFPGLPLDKFGRSRATAPEPATERTDAPSCEQSVEEKPANAEITRNPLPIEKKGGRLHIADSEIFCVRASAQRTTLFDGRDEFFCPLSISEIEARLPRRKFFRTHRGYIVNLEHVSGVRKVADAGVAELDSAVRRTAPISRGRVAALRQELAAFRAGKMASN